MHTEQERGDATGAYTRITVHKEHRLKKHILVKKPELTSADATSVRKSANGVLL
jgi:hypothetical protein